MIELSSNKIAMVDDEDYERLSRFKWSATGTGALWYAYRRQDGVHLRMHRYILGAEKGEEVDHRDGDGLNNQKYNLRRCTHAQNHYNCASRRGTSRFRGVYWSKREQRWFAKISPGGRTLSLGTFYDEISAAGAYNLAALKHYGEFARLNELGGERLP